MEVTSDHTLAASPDSFSHQENPAVDRDVDVYYLWCEQDHHNNDNEHEGAMKPSGRRRCNGRWAEVSLDTTIHLPVTHSQTPLSHASDSSYQQQVLALSSRAATSEQH